MWCFSIAAARRNIGTFHAITSLRDMEIPATWGHSQLLWRSAANDVAKENFKRGCQKASPFERG